MGGTRLQGGQEHMVARQWERQGGQILGETRSARWPGTEGGQTVGGTRSSKWPGRPVGQAVKDTLSARWQGTQGGQTVGETRSASWRGTDGQENLICINGPTTALVQIGPVYPNCFQFVQKGHV